MSGLRSIILHHSYYNGLRVKIPCSGHAYLLGTNGSGKTSALNLIPIFYGKDPSSLVARTADKKNFIDYYLPNQQSMIVYEYERLGGEVCCVVIYRREAGQYAYRFIKGAADDTLFQEDLEALYSRATPANELLKYELPKRGIEVSNQILNTIDYRSVIQNDPMSSGKRRRARSAAFTMGREAREFSLGGLGDKLQHIESLTAVALNKGRMLESLKSMIVDTMIHDHIAITPPQAHHKNKELWSDLASLQEFARDNSRLRKGLDAYAGLQEVRGPLIAHQEALTELIRTTQAEIRDLENKVDELGQQVEGLDDAQRTERNRLGELEARHGGAVADLGKWLDALEKERDDWEAMDIEAMKRRAEQRPSLESEAKLAESQLVALTAHAKEIDVRFSQQRKDVEKAFTTEERRLTDREYSVMRKQAVLANEAKEQAEHFNHQCRVELDEQHQASQKILLDIREGIEELYRKLNEAGRNLPGEDEDIAMSQEAVETAERELGWLDDANEEAKTSLDEARKAHEKAVEQLDEAEAEKGRRGKRVETLADQLYPPDNTLLAFLRESGLPWHDTLGKVVDSRLLLRKDLSPRLAEPAALKQAFGLEIDLTVLPRPESAEEEAVLQAKLEKAESDQRRAKATVEQRQDAARKALDELNERDKAATRARDRLRQGREKNEQARASHRALEHDVTHAKKGRCQAVEEQITEARQREEQQQTEAERERKALQDSHTRQRQQHKADQQADEQRLTAQLKSIKAEQGRIKGNLDAKCKELEIQHEQALSAEGVDPETLRKTKETITKAEEALKQIEEDQPWIRKHDDWLKDRWGAKPDKERALGEAQRLLEEVRRQQRTSKAQYQSRTSELNAEKRAAGTEAKKLKEEVETWEALDSHASILSAEIPPLAAEAATPSPAQTHVSGSAEQLVAELRRLVSSGNERKQMVFKAATLCHNLLGKHPQSKIYQEWLNLREHRRGISRHEEGTPAYNIEMMQDIEILLDDRLPQVERALIENIHSIGSLLSDYHENLRSLNSIVDQVSSQLHRNLNTDHSFDVISDVSIRVRSRIHDLGFWSELAAFGESWRHWLISGSNELPSTELLSRMMLLEDQMQHARMKPDDLQSMVELEIEFYEQARRVPIRSDADLGEASSVGISRLAILVLFSALTRYLCPNPDICITWPIDELGQLAPENIVRVFTMMRERNIALFCAEPRLSHELQSHFSHRVALSNKRGVMTMAPDAETARDNPLLTHLAGSMPAPPSTQKFVPR
ncbi:MULTISPECIES: ATP-binding protein [Halomonadaceae]|uniref:ATP-binding protein n=1 Tax=Halomonadaceae TaxID=28256 RepID=UPI00036392AB|nr:MULTISPECIES: ATP-binding protein [Halomonas]